MKYFSSLLLLLLCVTQISAADLNMTTLFNIRLPEQ